MINCPELMIPSKEVRSNNAYFISIGQSVLFAENMYLTCLAGGLATGHNVISSHYRTTERNVVFLVSISIAVVVYSADLRGINPVSRDVVKL